MSADTVEEAMRALYHASLIGRTDVVQSALASIRSAVPESGESIRCIVSRQRPEDGASALHLASQFNHADVVRALLNIDCDLSMVGTAGDFLGKTPYECSVKFSGGDREKDNFARQAYHVFLFEAVAMNKPDRVLRLLGGGVPVDILDGGPNRESLLHWACSFGHVEVSRVLLEHACDANVLNAAHESPLHMACKANNAQLVEMLLNEGAYSDLDYEAMLPNKPVNDAIVTLLKKAAHDPAFKPTFPLKTVFERMQAERQAAAAKVLDVFAAVEWDDERLERKARNKSNMGGDRDEEDEEDFLLRQPLLVLWPPAQRQRRTRGAPLVLHSNSLVYVSVVSSDIDIYPLLTWSGLMDALDSFGLTAHVKRSVPGSSISLCIDKNLCPKRHQFELVITEDRATLIGGDQTGLLYAIYAFIELMQLHSEVVVVRDGKEVNPAHSNQASNGNSAESRSRTESLSCNTPFVASNGSFMNGTAISLFPLVIQDWPDVANRAVMWSHRRSARLNARVVRNMIQLLSKLRINMIHLVVDCLHSGDSVGQALAKGDSNWANRIGTNDNVNSTENRDNTKLFAIFEVCSRHRVELVPTIVISSIAQNVDIDLLKNCACDTINVMFLFEQRAVAADMLAALSASGTTNPVRINSIEIQRTPISTLSIEAVIRTAVSNILQQVQIAGFSSVNMGASAWTQRAADPLRIASGLGLSAVLHHDLDTVYPAALFTKPVVAAQGFIATIGDCVARAQGKGGFARGNASRSGCGGISVFPAYMDSDFMTPMLMLKYYSFLHAGFAWNSSAMREMGLGLPSNAAVGSDSVKGNGAGLIKEVVSLLLFPEEARMLPNETTGPSGSQKSQFSQDALRAVMEIFTGELLIDEPDTKGNPAASSSTISSAEVPFSSGSTDVNINSSALESAPTSHKRGLYAQEAPKIVSSTSADVVRVEQIIWSLVTARGSVADALVPTKAEAALCLRYCRRALNSSKWGGGYKGRGGKSILENVLNNFASSIGTSSRSAKEQGVHDDASTCSTDIDELFACITVMSAVCRTLVLSYNQLQKEKTPPTDMEQPTSLTQLFSYLPKGTASDVANSLLEAVENCTGLWRRRFENIDFLKTGSEYAFDRKVSGFLEKRQFCADSNKTALINTVECAERTYLTFSKPSLPCRAIFEELNLKEFQKVQTESLIDSNFMSLFFTTTKDK
jgi:hypothetical protein